MAATDKTLPFWLHWHYEQRLRISALNAVAFFAVLFAIAFARSELSDRSGGFDSAWFAGLLLAGALLALLVWYFRGGDKLLSDSDAEHEKRYRSSRSSDEHACDATKDKADRTDGQDDQKQ